MSGGIDPRVAAWLREGPRHGPPSGLERTLAAARDVEQRPRWTFASAWTPRRAAGLGYGLPRVGLLPLLAMLALFLLMALAAIYVGSLPKPLRLPSALGPSADKFMAYRYDDAIYVARVDGSGKRKVSGEVEFAQSPVFSPDGVDIAFLGARDASATRGDLYVVPFDGSSPPAPISHGIGVILGETPEFSWSPDGTQIAFAGGDQNATPTDIYVAQADGSGVRSLTDGTMKSDLPTWSKIPNRIAYRAIAFDGTHMFLEYMEPNGTNVTQVTAVVAADGALSRIDWSPANISSTPTTEYGSAALWLVSYTEAFGFGTPSQVVLNGLRTSQLIYPWTQGIGGLQAYGAPWSPDGHRIAVLTANEGVVLEQYDDHSVYSGEIQRLGEVAECWIDWSPDGTAVYGGTPDGCTGTVVVPLLDPSSAFVTGTPMQGIPSWQP